MVTIHVGGELEQRLVQHAEKARMMPEEYGRQAIEMYFIEKRQKEREAVLVSAQERGEEPEQYRTVFDRPTQGRKPGR